MIYVTGDCHADFTRFNTKIFPEQYEMTKNGVWLTKEVPVKYLIKEQTERLLNR